MTSAKPRPSKAARSGASREGGLMDNLLGAKIIGLVLLDSVLGILKWVFWIGFGWVGGLEFLGADQLITPNRMAGGGRISI
jgi:hypothetical protein